MSEERLQKIEAAITRCVVILETMEKSENEREVTAREWRTKFERTLHGTTSSPGLLIKLDRLEQSQERAKWFIRLIAAHVLALVAAAIWTLLSR
jgi:hypothetical protein